MKTTPDEITRAEKKAAAVVTHVEITTDIAIWDESVTPGCVPDPRPQRMAITMPMPPASNSTPPSKQRNSR